MNEKKKEEKAQELSNVKDFNTESKINQEYEQQYDPNNDFAIFGIGNTAMGGIQDMKEKMNMADAKDQESSDESEIDTARQNQMAQASATKAQLLAQNAESYKLSIPTILEPSSS